jgi:cyclopropane-fatty-acyl-phospholipid synthase
MLWSIGLRRFVRQGSLTVIDAGGASHHFGQDSAPHCTIRLHDKALHSKLLLNPDLYLGESYMDGTLTVEAGTLPDLLTIFGMNLSDQPAFFMEAVEDFFCPIINRIQQFNPARRAKQNVAHHYDLSETLYRLFLDDDLQYSCGYFADPSVTLAHAQRHKKAHIAAKLYLKPGMRVLDIGCGWGGLAIYLAQQYGVEVTGITLSEEQHRVATARALAAGLQDKVRFHLRDYRDETGQYDRIVSVGMFEHVGTQHYRAFFAKVKSLLTGDGVALLHTIGRDDGPGTTNPWLRKYIFPGAGAPALSEVTPVIEKSGLWTTDIEILRLHYSHTLDAWYERFQTHRAQVASLYDERFCRMWEFYLASCSAYFRYCGVVVFQIQLAKNIATLPITRDYMLAEEQALMRAPDAQLGMAA